MERREVWAGVKARRGALAAPRLRVRMRDMVCGWVNCGGVCWTESCFELELGKFWR